MHMDKVRSAVLTLPVSDVNSAFCGPSLHRLIFRKGCAITARPPPPYPGRFSQLSRKEGPSLQGMRQKEGEESIMLILGVRKETIQ